MSKPLPAWFRDARLGMFIHYGLYSLFGGNENGIRREIGREAYAAAIRRFHAREADPDAWADLAKRSGCSYLVLTAKHGEGFCLWPSRHTTCHIGNSPCRRDLVGETIAACRRRGLRVGIYFGPQTWISPVADGDRAGYRAMVLGMIEELMGNYGRIDLLWLDTSEEPRLDRAIAAELARRARQLQPGLLINNRGAPEGASPWGDFITPERFLPDRTAAQHLPFEACDSIGVKSWGWHADERFWSLPELERRLAGAASLGGRYLLNVQPEAGGRIRPECVERLRGLGDWMKRHGRALAGGRCALVPRDPHREDRPSIGVAIAAPGRIDLLLDRWPDADEVLVPRLSGRLSASLGGRRLQTIAAPDGLRICGLPAQPAAPEVQVITVRGRPRIDVRGLEEDGLPVRRPGLRGLWLDPAQARCASPDGVPLHHMKRLADGRTSIGFFSTSDASVEWAVQLDRPGRWRVIARLARPAEGEQAPFQVEVGPRRLTGQTVATTGWDDPADIDLGVVALSAGRHLVRLTVQRLVRHWFADVHGLGLQPCLRSASRA